uniref:Uncharacterized protein n=1 Tax=Nelumbo nucifera TaxID=4432 RepID=A0A822YLV3_NELNU|nr:TPA_asm: hypothetical protein HUJ06_012421 [Nelumbo nucifera]
MSINICKMINQMITSFFSGKKYEGGMGYRHIWAFSRALLTRKASRLIRNPYSLWSKLIKGKYFPYSTFWEATIGHKASQAWRSLLWGKDVLKKGCIWRIGNESSMRIWEDKWIPNQGNSQTYDQNRENCPLLQVQDLLTQHPRRWNMETNRQWFHPQEANVIQSIPISWGIQEDTII